MTPKRSRQALAPGEVHLWYLELDGASDSGELSSGELSDWEALITPDERERHRRLVFEHSRREFLATRVLARRVLSCYADVEPTAWRFGVPEKNGKPEIESPAEAQWLRFNLSNTAGLVVCGVSRDLEVGVDVEAVDRSSETSKIARRFFSSSESADVLALPEPQARARFFEYWTLKEAYIKARGLGLKLPLHDFSFHLDEEAGIRISFEGELAEREDPRSWCFWQRRLAEGHTAAVARWDPSGEHTELAVTLHSFATLP